MKRKQKKSVYCIGSVILAILLFFGLFMLDVDNRMVNIESSGGGQGGNEGGIGNEGAGAGESSSDEGENGSGEGENGSGEGENGSGEGENGSGEGENGSGEGENGSGEGENGSGEGEGGSGSGTGGVGNGVLFRVTSDISHLPIYLREDGYGVYTGNGEHGFSGDKKYYYGKDEVNPLYYFAYMLEQNGYAVHTAQVELVNFEGDLLPYYPLQDTGRGKEEMTYSVPYYDYDYLSRGLGGLLPLTGDLAAQEEKYREKFVDKYYLDIDTELQSLLYTLADENNIEYWKDTHTVVTQVVEYIQNAAYYDMKWATKNYPSDKDMVTYFLTEENRGVCRHFAAAATMMFRALGIPARYTIGFAVPVFANTWTEWRDAGHAWTEIYLDGYGWVPLEVTGSNFAPDSSEDEPEKEEDGGVSYYVYLQEEKRYAAGTPKGER